VQVLAIHPHQAVAETGTTKRHCRTPVWPAMRHRRAHAFEVFLRDRLLVEAHDAEYCAQGTAPHNARVNPDIRADLAPLPRRGGIEWRFDMTQQAEKTTAVKVTLERKPWVEPKVTVARIMDAEAGVNPTNETIDTLNGGPS
jgi:hypothetical protein